MDFRTDLMSVSGRAGMVASSQAFASQAGLELLDAGGTAADAAVAMAAALAVTEPNSTGPGGDAFCLYYEAATGAVHALNGSGRAPSALTIDRLRQQGITDRIPPEHPDSVTVPGAVAAWFDLHARFGRLPVERVLAPAVHLARDGFTPGPLNSYYWRKAWQKQLAGRPAADELRLPEAGLFRNSGMARTLECLIEGGSPAFYGGPLAHAIVEAISAKGGCVTLADLAVHRSEWTKPLSVDFDGLSLWECGPNSQGMVALQALEILKHTAIRSTAHLSTNRLHYQLEALKLAIHDALANLADPAVVRMNTAAWLSPEYNRELAAGIDPTQAVDFDARPAARLIGSDTVYFCVVDAAGNACSMVNSNFVQFGSGIIPPGWGFSLQNRGLGFSLDPTHPNALAPGKRPYHTIIPALLTRVEDGSLAAVLGVMGGAMQPQGHLQVMLNMVLDGLDPQAALNAPRFCIDLDSADRRIWIEEGMPPEAISGLQNRGHPLEVVCGLRRSVFGRGQVILVQSDGRRTAGTDPRADGCALSQ